MKLFEVILSKVMPLVCYDRSKVPSCIFAEIFITCLFVLIGLLIRGVLVQNINIQKKPR